VWGWAVRAKHMFQVDEMNAVRRLDEQIDSSRVFAKNKRRNVQKEPTETQGSSFKDAFGANSPFLKQAVLFTFVKT
jgi:hypothetical protein